MSDNGFWIPQVTVTTFVGYFNFLFGRISLVPLFILVVLFYVKNHKEIPMETISGILIPVLVILVGTLVSIIFVPSFIPRYVLPVVLCVCVAIIIAIHKAGNNSLKVVSVFVISGIIIGNVILFADQQLIRADNDEIFKQICEFSEDDKIVTDDWFLAGCVDSERKNAYYCGKEIEFTNHYESELFTNINSIDKDNLSELKTSNDGKIYFLTVPNLLVCPQAALMYCHETAQVGVITS